MAAALVRMVMTASFMLASSAGGAGTGGPAAGMGLTFSGGRVRTLIGCSTSMWRSALAAPIFPVTALDATVEAIIQARVSPRIVVEASTFAIDDKLRAERALRKAGHVMLDCPVSGTGAQAKTKDLVIYASGEPKAIRALRPLFAAFARAVHDLGAFGNGSRMKYVANLLVAINNVASAEAMVLGLKAGLDAQTVFDMVRSGAANSRVFELRAPMMVEDRYDGASMKMSVWQKDMAVIGEFAHSLGCPTPMFDATVPIYDKAMRGGHAAHDTAAVCAVLEKMAGVKRKTRQRAKRP